MDLSKEYKQWYLSVIDFIESEMPRLSRREQDKLKNILGDSLNGFGFERYLDIIEECCIKFGSDREWWQGWIGLGGVKVHYKERFDRSEKEVLNRLIASVEPTDSVSRMICILQNSLYELQAYFSTEEMIKEECKKLTVSFIEQPDLLDQLFFKLKGTCLFWGAFFGEELAKTEGQGTFAPLWPKICKVLDDDLSIAKAYLNVKYKCDKKKTIALLDSLEDTNNASQSVHLHFLLECSKDYLEHILKLLTDGIVDINCVSHLWYMVAGGKIEENDFLDFLLKIMDVDQGTSVVLNVFWSYYCDLKREGPLPKCAKEVGCEIIIKAVKKIEPKSAYDLNNKLEKLIDACFLSGDISKEEIEKLFSVLKSDLIVRKKCVSFSHNRLMLLVAKKYVEEFLDIVVGEESSDHVLEKEIEGRDGGNVNIIDKLDPERVFLWADTSVRRFRLVELSSGFYMKNDQYQWTELAKKLLDTEDGAQVLERFAKKIPYTICYSDRSEMLRKHQIPLQGYEADEYLGEVTRKALGELKEEIIKAEEDERQEQQMIKATYEKFEY